MISPYIYTIFIAWFSAHIIKYFLDYLNGEKSKITSYLTKSGGMPSSHSATVVALAVFVGLNDGFHSGLFGVSLLLAIIVMYDATKVRRSNGEQGIALKQLISEQKSNVKLPVIIRGHTVIEVVCGALLGLVIGVVVFFSTI